MRRRPRLTLAGRLTTVYGTLFAATTIVIAGASYLLLRASIAGPPGPEAAADVVQLSPQERAVLNEETAARFASFFEQTRLRVQSEALGALAGRSAIVLAVTIPVVTWLAWRLTRRSLRPLTQITALAQDISESNLDRRIRLDGPPDELKRLADTFDGMLARLERAFAAERGFAAHASHELRTPLATLAAEADLVLATGSADPQARALASVARRTVDQADQMLGSLLALARVDSGTWVDDVVDLADLCGLAVSGMTGLATRSDVAIDLVLEDAEVRGDPVLLNILVRNLVLNGIRHNDHRGRVAVGLTASGPDAVLTVTNTGPEVSPAQLAELFTPFGHRQDATGGLGLGTVVIRAVAEAHRGRVSAVPRAGGGLAVTVALPAVRRAVHA